MRIGLAGLMIVILSGCSSIPYGEFDGARDRFVDPDEYDVVVVAVDGQMYMDGRTRERLKPGFHWLQIASTKPGRRGEISYQGVPINVKPCTRYSFSAKHANRFNNFDWELVVRGEKLIPSCKLADISKTQ